MQQTYHSSEIASFNFPDDRHLSPSEFQAVQYRASRIDYSNIVKANPVAISTPINNEYYARSSNFYSNQSSSKTTCDQAVQQAKITNIDDVIKNQKCQPPPPKRSVSCQRLVEDTPAFAKKNNEQSKIPPPPPLPTDLKNILASKPNASAALEDQKKQDSGEAISFKQMLAQRKSQEQKKTEIIDSKPLKTTQNGGKIIDFNSDLKSAIEKRRTCLETSGNLKVVKIENPTVNNVNCETVQISSVRGSATSLKESVANNILNQSNAESSQKTPRR